VHAATPFRRPESDGAAIPERGIVAWRAPAYRWESAAEVRAAFPGVEVSGAPLGDAFGLEEAVLAIGEAPLDPQALSEGARLIREGAIFTRHVQRFDRAVVVHDLGEAIAALREARRERSYARVDVTGLSRAHVRRALVESAPEGRSGAGVSAGASAGAGEGGGAGEERGAWALSAIVVQGRILLGSGPVADLVSPWPGGDPHYAIEPVSRAGAKLREALVHLGNASLDGLHALDLGAAPGGFTSVLLERGARVTAIDPARISDALKDNPRLDFRRAYAVAVEPASIPPADLLTCDVVTAPALTAALVMRFAERLRVGAPAVVTLKLRPTPAPSEQIAAAVALFAPLLTLERIRHLRANRCEVTAFFRRA